MSDWDPVSPCSSQAPADPTRAPAQLHPGVWLATGAKQQSWGFPLVLLILVYRPHTTPISKDLLDL